MSAHVKAQLRMIETNAWSIFLTDPKISKYLGITIYNHHPENFRKFKPHYLSISIYPQHASVTPDRKSMHGA